MSARSKLERLRTPEGVVEELAEAVAEAGSHVPPEVRDRLATAMGAAVAHLLQPDLRGPAFTGPGVIELGPLSTALLRKLDAAGDLRDPDLSEIRTARDLIDLGLIERKGSRMGTPIYAITDKGRAAIGVGR